MSSFASDLHYTMTSWKKIPICRQCLRPWPDPIQQHLEGQGGVSDAAQLIKWHESTQYDTKEELWRIISWDLSRLSTLNSEFWVTAENWKFSWIERTSANDCKLNISAVSCSYQIEVSRMGHALRSWATCSSVLGPIGYHRVVLACPWSYD